MAGMPPHGPNAVHYDKYGMGAGRDFIFVTHTRWDEPPRIRHQLARLIADAGHRVLFFERADGPFFHVARGASEVEPGILLTRTNRLLHHQFRVAPPLDWANGLIVRRQLLSQAEAAGFRNTATVVNFAHDCPFLRDVFPGSEVITIIHDDFEAQARLPAFGHVTRMLRQTCIASDRVFALSNVLCKRLQEWVPAELFYPWSTVPYRRPVGDPALRDTLLFWGYIDVGIDTDAVRRISRRLAATRPDMRILMVGPTQSPSRRKHTTRHLEDLPNVIIQGAAGLEALPMERVLAALIPYRRKGDADAVELPNKLPQLLAYGLPILKTGMPHAVRSPFILPVEDDAALDAGIDACIREFWNWQPSISAFLGTHSAAARLKALRIEPAR
jgi:hypothetical protein